MTPQRVLGCCGEEGAWRAPTSLLRIWFFEVTPVPPSPLALAPRAPPSMDADEGSISSTPLMVEEEEEVVDRRGFVPLKDAPCVPGAHMAWLPLTWRASWAQLVWGTAHAAARSLPCASLHSGPGWAPVVFVWVGGCVLQVALVCVCVPAFVVGMPLACCSILSLNDEGFGGDAFGKTPSQVHLAELASDERMLRALSPLVRGVPLPGRARRRH
jgi:hypothetical protein